MNRVYSLFVVALALVTLDLLAVRCAYATDVKITCTSPTTNTDGTPITAAQGILTFNLYGGLSGQTKQKLVTGAATCSFTRTSVAPGTQEYQVTAVTGTVESALSSIASVVVAPPTPNPPTGVAASVQASNTSAYKMRQAVDGFSFVAIGTIPVGTACDMTHNVDGYSVIARSNVTLTSRFDTLPLVVYAKCG